jgi:hypothetical protein
VMVPTPVRVDSFTRTPAAATVVAAQERLRNNFPF